MQQSSNKPYEGFFITIEGGDGCGKTTLANRLAERLEKKGYHLFRTREPGGNPLSESIREILLNPGKELSIASKTELLLYLAARAQNVELSIKPALYHGDVVICERFNDSTIAYQGCARNLGMHYVKQICHLLFDEPDFTLFLDLDPEEGIRRVKMERKESFDRLEQEKIQFHKEVRQAFLHLADESPERIVIVDAAQPIEQIVEIALQALEPRLLLKPSLCKEEACRQRSTP